MKCSALAGSLLILGDLVGAVRLGVNGVSSLHRRGNLQGIGNTTLTNTADVQYQTKVTIGGRDYLVLIDTGSADLWVADVSVPNSQDLGLSSTVGYVSGSVQGSVRAASLQFVGYNVKNQAFIQVAPDSQNPQGAGVIGLGPNDGSNIFRDMGKSPAGNTILNSLFLQNVLTPNIFTILLGRSDDPSDMFPGDLTIGEILPGYEDIDNQPKLNVSKASGTQHFQALLDENGIIGPDGNPIPVRSGVKTVKNKNQAMVIFDSGYTLPQVPKSVSEAIYGRFKGADLVNIAGLGDTWVLPCTTEVNMSFAFAGKNFTIHPLDSTVEPSTLSLSNVKTSTGEDGCFGTFQPIGAAASSGYDMIFGMAFLRNAYMLINFGDFIDGNTSITAKPFIQLLSITNDTAETHNDFVKVRLNGIDTTGDTNLLPAKVVASSPDSKRRTIYIIAGTVGGCLVLIAIAALLIGCFKRRNRYQRLGNPAPAAPTDMYMAAPTGQHAYRPGPVYDNPFEHQRR